MGVGRGKGTNRGRAAEIGARTTQGQIRAVVWVNANVRVAFRAAVERLIQI